MCEKTTIGFVRDAIDPVILQKVKDQLVERFGVESIEFVELEGDFAYGKCPLDIFGPDPRHIVDKLITAACRQPFHHKYADRIDRHNRVWPRLGCPMLQWNRKHKWLPRFYDTPRRSYFSQSQLRLSQVSSWPSASISLQRPVCSLEGLDLSRWP